MGAIGGMLGTSTGINGTGISAPTMAPITPGTNQFQLDQAYQGNQNALSQQQALLAALQAQNGLGNQSQVYNQLQGVANGTGPNPAQAQLAQATAANTQNQAALMAGQRGSGANAGLIARQAAQQGAANQQNAAGQAASLQAQQSLNAIGQAGALANQQAANQIAGTGAVTQAQQNEQQILQNANAGFNNALVSGQNNINSVQGQIANNIVGQQSKGWAGLASGASFAQGGQVPAYDDGGPTTPNTGVSSTSPSDSAEKEAPNSGAGSVGGGDSSQSGGGSGAGLASVIGMVAAAADGGQLPSSNSSTWNINFGGNTSSPGSSNSMFSGLKQQGMAALGSQIKSLFSGSNSAPTASGGDTTPGATANAGNNYATAANNYGTDAGASAANYGAQEPSMPDMNATSQQTAAPSLGVDTSVAAQARGGKITTPPTGKPPMKRFDTSKPAKNLKAGGHVQGGKAPMKGNSLKNDTVPAMLSPGEVVIPRSIMHSKDPVSNAAKFVGAIMMKKQGGKKK